MTHTPDPKDTPRPDADGVPASDAVQCHMCFHELPRSAAMMSEGLDYVQYFCGLDCLAKWRRQSESRVDRTRDDE